MAMVLVTMVGTEDTMAMGRDLLMLNPLPLLMLMLMLGMEPMAMVLDTEGMVDTMDMLDHMDTMEDTGERRRGLLMLSLQQMLMLMPTLTILDTTVLVLDTVHMDMDTPSPQLAGVDTEVDTTGDKIFLL